MKKFLHKIQAFIILSIVGTIIFTAPQVLGQKGVFSGYGYGEECSIEAPTNLRKHHLVKKERIQLRWKVVDAAICENIVNHYDVQVRKHSGALVESYTDIPGNKKMVPTVILQPNQAYKFRVRAVMEDGTKTDWSAFRLFRTLPAAPEVVSVKQVSVNTIKASWKNIRKSRDLEYYKVVVMKGSEKVFTTNHRKGLRGKRTYVEIMNLEPNISYTLKVKSVFSKKIQSKFQQQEFSIN